MYHINQYHVPLIPDLELFSPSVHITNLTSNFSFLIFWFLTDRCSKIKQRSKTHLFVNFETARDNLCE